MEDFLEVVAAVEAVAAVEVVAAAVEANGVKNLP